MNKSIKYIIKKIAVFSATVAVCGMLTSNGLVYSGKTYHSWEFDDWVEAHKNEVRASGGWFEGDTPPTGVATPAPETKPVVKTCDHKYNSKVSVGPTCKVDGEMIFTCTKCNDTYTEKIPATESHTYTLVETVDAKCEEDGENTYKCETCDLTYDEKISATGHDYTEKITLVPTCLDKGIVTKVCNNCNDTIETEIAAKGHTEGEYEITKKAGLFTDGEKIQKCIDCDEILVTEVIESQYPVSALYIIIGVALLIIGLVIFVIARKKK